MELDLTILDSAGIEVDREARDFDVPDLRAAVTLVPRLLAPEIVRVQSVRDLQSSVATDAAPSASRSFTRTDQLLVRSPGFDSTGLPVRMAARLLNRSGQTIRDLDVVDSATTEEPQQFLLPLFSLPPDLYQIEIVGTNSNGTTTARVGFRLMR